MVLRIKLTVFRTADFALCLVLAGRFPAGVLSQLLAAIITLGATMGVIPIIVKVSLYSFVLK